MQIFFRATISLSFLLFSTGGYGQHLTKADIIGTNWHYESQGLDNKLDYQITFLMDGTFETDHTSTGPDDWWELNNGILEIHWNDNYSISTGRMKSPSSIVGTASNEVGSKWKSKLTKVDTEK